MSINNGHLQCKLNNCLKKKIAILFRCLASIWTELVRSCLLRSCGWGERTRGRPLLQHKKRHITRGPEVIQESASQQLANGKASKRVIFQNARPCRVLMWSVWLLPELASWTLKLGLERRWAFSKALRLLTCKSWNGTTGMGWHLSQQPSLPQINATLLGSQPLHTLAGRKGEDSVPGYIWSLCIPC